MSKKNETLNKREDQQNGENSETQFQTKEVIDEPIMKRSLWTSDQKIMYVLFLQNNLSDFDSQQSRRAKKVFMHLSQHIESRTVLQCKSHHQKMLAKFKSIPKIIKSYLSKAERLRKNALIAENLEQEIICKNQSETEIMKLIQEDFYNENEENNSLWQGIDWGYFNKQVCY